jgi:NAD(P) transhydrogenase subunit alpha
MPGRCLAQRSIRVYVNVAVLKETLPHERRVALVPSVIPKLVKLGARLHMQSGAADAIRIPGAAYDGVVFMDDRNALVADADVVLAVQPPALAVIDAMKPGAILICFVYAANEPELMKTLLAKKITCFAMERIPRISRAQAMDALSSQSALAGYYAVGLGMTRMAKVLPRCLIPGFDGAVFSREWKEALWAKFSMGAPQRQRRSVERYSIVKRA